MTLPPPPPQNQPQPQPQAHEPCREVIELSVQVKELMAWKETITADIKAINDVISQVKLLMNLSIGGGFLSIVSLAVLLANIFAK